MPRRNWPYRLRRKRKKHRAHRMKRQTPAQRRHGKGRGDEPTKKQVRKKAAGSKAPEGVVGRQSGTGQEEQVGEVQ